MRILWADLAKAHRDLIATKALDDGPFLTRLWYHHLFWLCSFLKSAVTIKASGIGFLVRRQCYRAADRLFGGTREEAYCEKLNRNAETLSVASTVRKYTKPSPIPISWQRPTPTKTGRRHSGNSRSVEQRKLYWTFQYCRGR